MARYVFTGGNGISGETGLVHRDGLNNNFNELYAVMHTRAHLITSASDHSPATGTDKGKYLKNSAATGAPIWSAILDADIPDTIARQADLASHIGNHNNPHEVTLAQIAVPGPGIEFGVVEHGTAINALAKDDRGLGVGQFGFSLDAENVSDLLLAAELDLVDRFFIHRKYGAVDSIFAVSLQELKGFMFMAGGGGALSYYNLVPDDGKVVDVTATGPGIVGTWSLGNTLTLDVPEGVEITALNIQLAGYPNMYIIANFATDRLHKQFPMMQAWRQDTQNQLVGVVLNGDAGIPNKFTISGLINTTTNFIKLAL